MLKQTASGVDPGRHINFGGGDRDYVDLGSYQDVVYGHDIAGRFGVRLSWNTSTTTYFTTVSKVEMHKRTLKSVGYEVSWGIEDVIFIDKLRYDIDSVDASREWFVVSRDSDGKHRLTTSFSQPDEDGEIISSPEKCYILPWTAPYGPKKADDISILNMNSEFERFIDKIHYIGPLRRRPERHYLWTGGRAEIIEPDGANAIQALIASSREGGSLLSTVENMLQAMGLVDTFNIKSIDQNQRLYEATAEVGGVESSLRDVGFGVSQVFPVLTMLLSAPMGSIILLEQPELHLHPNAQAALADLMLYVAETRNLQLIVESHSEHIVRRLQRRIAEANPAFATPENIKMYYCQSGETGSTISEVIRRQVWTDI